MNGPSEDKAEGLAVANDAAETMPQDTPSPNDKFQDLTTRALRFLSTATPETLGGVAVGLAACTYLVLGRVGLILIGAVGGVVLHATWEGQSVGTLSIEYARREKGLDIVRRILDLREAQAQSEDNDEDIEAPQPSLECLRPQTAAALNELVDAVIRDYVKWWYHPILPKDQSFPAASRRTLTKFILAVSNHLSRKRPADTFLDFLTNSSSIVIVFLNELSSALMGSPGTNVPPAEAVYTYLSANPDSNLANVLNEKQQLKKFKMIAEDILQNFLEKTTFDCDPARLFLRELLGGLILDMTLKSCSKPEWINGWIVYLLEDGEPDFSQAIDAGMDRGSGLLSSPFNDLDGNMGNIGLAKAPATQGEKQEVKRHKKRLSKAEEAMEEAMEEAKRLSQLIADEEAKKVQIPGERPLDDAPKALLAAVEKNAESLHLDVSALSKGESVTSPETAKPVLTGAVKSNPRGAIKEIGSLESAGTRSSLKIPDEPRASHDLWTRPMKEDPISPVSSVSPTSSSNASAPFTSFDQIIPQSTPALDGSLSRRRQTASLTLHNANIIIMDDSIGAEKGRLRNKPSADYLLQIEPASSDHPGWMIIRKYPDFESLHEVLRRIAQVSGVIAFTEQHKALPLWKEHTKSSLRGELERYLRDACWYKELAESEGMKRFLEKDQGQGISSPAVKKAGLGWPTPSTFDSLGKGMLDTLTSAPEGLAKGGKAIGGGISGVFTNIGNLGQKKTNGSNSSAGMHNAGRSSTSTLPRKDSLTSLAKSDSISSLTRMDSMNSAMAPRSGRVSEDSLRPASIVATQPAKLPGMERKPSYNSVAENEPRSSRSSISGRRSATHSREPSIVPSRRGTPLSSPTTMNEMKLPPPPSEIRDDYADNVDDSSTAPSHTRAESSIFTTRTSTSTAPSPGRSSSARRPSVPSAPATIARKARKEATPLSEQETRVAVELLFAVITELYTLSSAWNIRRTLLTAAKTFLLRPGNPSLTSIQSLIQESIIASNTSDAGVATHLRKLRENSLPTEEELKAWPAVMTAEEKERLRIKARKLLVERGVPAALSGVMGQAATGEAVGKVFDCLQVEEVARGLVFGLLLQGARAITH